jgi:hypothetical protein
VEVSKILTSFRFLQERGAVYELRSWDTNVGAGCTNETVLSCKFVTITTATNVYAKDNLQNQLIIIEPHVPHQKNVTYPGRTLLTYLLTYSLTHSLRGAVYYLKS